MASKSKQKAKEQNDIALQKFNEGCKLVEEHPIFAQLIEYTNIVRRAEIPYHQTGLAYVNKLGIIYCNPKIRATPEEWAHAIAHCLLHLGMQHFKQMEFQNHWNIACDCIVEKFLADLKFRKLQNHLPNGINDEQKLYERLVNGGIKPEFCGFGTAGENLLDMDFEDDYWHSSRKINWSALLAAGLNNAVKSAVSVAAGDLSIIYTDGSASLKTRAEEAKTWFISSYPLLGAIASRFKLIEDPIICQRMEISIAAIFPFLFEIYINPAAALTKEECKFVMAHEFLHAALRHDARHQWRDAYLWNVACDYVINDWLTEMGVGEQPVGLLYDTQFKGLNAESIYDRIVTDIRTFRKLATLRGVGLGDVLSGNGNWWERGEGVDLDEFYRRALGQGLTYHQEQERGYLPASLVEEIRALSHPPIPWDVELANWFDEQFTPLEKVRSYARPSRRQSSTPDIPRPNWVVSQTSLDGRTFGVVLDTSGSMDRSLLASALGAIASYSVARDVPAVRVVFCDAEAYDQGYMKPEDIAETVKVKGRGGTVLQPGIDYLLNSDDFPKDAPLLIITDGECDKVVVHGREHAYLVPHWASLPFVARGKVFRMR